MQAFRVAVNNRQSNMELLRIVAMFMIVVYHTVYYVFYDYRGDSPFFASLMTLLHIGVPLFVLISGYFGIKPSKKGALRLYVILLFYNLLFYGLRLICGDVSFSYKAFIKLFFPFSIGSRYWFFKVYLMLYIMSPILTFVRDEGGGRKLLIISGLITFYWGWFAHHPSLWDGKNLINFIFLYMLGGWLRVSFDCTDKKIVRKYSIVVYLVIVTIIGWLLYFSNESIQDTIKRLCYGYNSPVLILMSVTFFLFFASFDFKSKLVNWIASSVFAVYLVHENYWFYRDQWYSFLEHQYLTYHWTLFVPVLLVECFALFVGAILLDKIQRIITSPIMPLCGYVQNRSERLGTLINDFRKRL